MVRSTDIGTTWSGVLGGLTSETLDFSLGGSRWIAVGSDSNVVDSGGTIPPSSVGRTIVYSDDLGVNWNPTATGYSFSGISVMHGPNGWVSTGIDHAGGQYQSRLTYSPNGNAWFDIPLGITLPSTGNPPGPWPQTSLLQRHGPVYCNGDVWSVFVSYSDIDGFKTELYQHDVSTSLENGWVRVDLTSRFPATSIENRFTGLVGPLYIPQIEPFVTTLTYTDLSTVGGPTFTSPTQTEYIVYQYIPITPITVAATGAIHSSVHPRRRPSSGSYLRHSHRNHQRSPYRDWRPSASTDLCPRRYRYHGVCSVVHCSGTQSDSPAVQRVCVYVTR
jgi:hypothetical protein